MRWPLPRLPATVIRRTLAARRTLSGDGRTSSGFAKRSKELLRILAGDDRLVLVAYGLAQHALHKPGRHELNVLALAVLPRAPKALVVILVIKIIFYLFCVL